MDLEKYFYQGRFKEIKDFLYSQSIDQAIQSSFLAKIYIEEGLFNEAKNLLEDKSSTQNNEHYYLRLIAEICLSGFTHESLEQLEKLSLYNEKYKMAYSSALYSCGRYKDSSSLASVINIDLLSDAQKVLFLQLKCLLKLEENNYTDNEYYNFRSFAYKIVNENDFWLLKPYLLFLDIKKELISGDENKAKTIAETSLLNFQGSKFKKSTMAIERFLANQKLNENQKINLNNKPQLKEVFDKMKTSDYLSKESIFNLLYDEEYNPILHDSRIYMIIRRLKTSISNSNLMITKSTNGWKVSDKQQ